MEPRFRATVLHHQREAAEQLVGLLAPLDVGVEIASSGTDAMRRIRQRTPHVIIAGHKPPHLDAPAFLEATIAHAPEALRIALVESPDDAVELDFRPAHAGTIIRFVARPHERSRLMALIGEGVKLAGLIEESRTLTRRLAAEHKQLQRRQTLLDVVVKERTEELEESYRKLKAANRQALFGLAEAIEAKDPYTKGHCGRVAAYTLVLAREAGYPDDGMETLEFGAFLHDIGKIGIKDAVLLKPGPLDDAEWVHMREHPVKGYEIASKIEMLKPIMSAVRNHHERWDGSGYPDKMKGEAIPLAARMVAIADAFDAMITDRPYKAGLPLPECKKLLRKHAGGMFDPDLIEIFISRGVCELYEDELGAEPDELAVGADRVVH
ncbi:MAG TPA: HD domain-containing phosphohydrolase [Kofleriaceae bacterium]|nr:HD domain-containing phosphohydrolase [Kofleriaceae bacterium]